LIPGKCGRLSVRNLVFDDIRAERAGRFGMTTRLVIAYLLILLLASGAIGTIWWMIHNSPRQRMRRYQREKHTHRN